MANYPQELAQDAVCQSHTGHMTGLWFLPTRSLRLNTNECICVYIIYMCIYTYICVCMYVCVCVCVYIYIYYNALNCMRSRLYKVIK